MSHGMRVVSCAAVLVACAVIGLAGAGSAVAAVDCSQLAKRGIAKQTNLHASALLVACGQAEGGVPATDAARGQAPSALALGGSDINLITGGEVFPQVTQSESFVWAHGATVVVKYNDSRTAPDNYSGVSVSTDGGATFTRLLPSPFATGHGNNFGDPTVVYDAKLGKWFASDLATGCGGQGIGIWESTAPASSWTPGACAHSGFGDDRQSMWVDNNAASPHYGRMYISWNDFDRGGALVVTYSDTGTTWSAPVTLSGSFIRDVQLTGSPGADGAVFVAAMDEGGGGFNSRQNLIYRSTDGGLTWTQVILAARFAAAGDSACDDNSYFTKIDPIWRHMGWGQPAAGPGGVVAYNYAGHGAGTDPADIYFTRSTNNGSTWSTPVKLNTDNSGKAQWMPSLLITQGGVALATWYDRRNTTDGFNYERFGRISTDNGATWGPEMAISDVLIPQPVQPDPFVQACYAGDYNYITANGDTGYDTWTDGRVAINGLPQQDVFFDKIPLSQNRPTTKDQCKNGGWRTYGIFKNQGDCVSFVATKGKNPPAGP